MPLEMEYVNCDLCRSDDTRFLYATRDRLLSLPGEFRLVKCRNCGLVYLNPRPAKHALTRYYTKQYFDFIDSGTFRLANSALLRLLNRAWIFYERKVFGWDFTLEDFSRGKVLDVGCGTGTFLRALKNRGWEVYGVDLSPIATKKARQLGVEVFTGELNEARYPSNFFDVVTLRSTLEHVYSPSDMLREVRRVMHERGRVVIEVPNFSSLESRIFKESWFGLEAPRHLYHFTSSTLSGCLRKCGFVSIRFRQSPDPSMSLLSLNYLVKGRLVQKASPMVFIEVPACPPHLLGCLFRGRIGYPSDSQ